MKKIIVTLNHLKFIIYPLILALLILVLINQAPTQAQVTTYLSDQNNDGVIDLTDARINSPPQTSNCPVCANVNGDDVVDDFDEAKVQENLGKTENENKTIKIYDVNNDDKVDNTDIQILNNYKGQKMQAGSFGLDKPEDLSFGYKVRELVIGFNQDVTSEQITTILAQHNLSQIRDGGRSNVILVSSQTDDLDTLAKDIVNNHSEVKYVEKRLYGQGLDTSDTYWNQQWGLRHIGVENVWLTETTGHPSVKVAVLDSGVDVSHPDLSGAIGDKYNASGDNLNVTDFHGHGTGMAGIIAARRNNFRDIAGIAPSVTILPVKVTVRDLPLCDAFAVGRGVIWAIDHGARVINMSFGCPDNNFASDALYNASQLGITLVASTGNSYRTDGVSFPANHSKVIGVGAYGLDAAGSIFILDSTNRGPGLDMYAPGAQIISLDSSTSGGAITSWAYYTGTSPAAAHVSGVAALRQTVCDAQQMRINICYLDDPFDVINAYTTVWRSNCFKVDYHHDHLINARDNYQLFRRWLQTSGSPLYHQRYDIRPVAGGDGVIDIIDLQTMVGLYYGNRCPQNWHLHP